jgi:hypothetical protein
MSLSPEEWRTFTSLCLASIRLESLQQVVAKQALDEGLWFNAQTAAEAYLQQELRRLHEMIELGLGG